MNNFLSSGIFIEHREKLKSNFLFRFFSNVVGSRIKSEILQTLGKATYAKSATFSVGPKSITAFYIVNPGDL